MPEGYHAPDEVPDVDGDPRLAIRRHADRCFHRVEELAPRGYIVDGIFIDEDDVAEVRKLGSDGAPLPRCEA